MKTRPDHLFVYGTLQAEAQHPMGDLLRANATLLGRGSIQARLYIIEETDAQGINRYPGAVPSAFADDRVHGALYRVHHPENVFDAFDDFEACAPGWPEPYEFLLRPVDVVLETGEIVRAGSYLYAWDTSRAELITSGQYVRVSSEVR